MSDIDEKREGRLVNHAGKGEELRDPVSKLRVAIVHY